jgi:hypothetical protein
VAGETGGGGGGDWRGRLAGEALAGRLAGEAGGGGWRGRLAGGGGLAGEN